MGGLANFINAKTPLKILYVVISLVILLIIVFFAYTAITLAMVSTKSIEIAQLLESEKIKSIEESYSDDILNLPLYHFFINSSHNSYINGNQHASLVMSSNLEYVLKAGARCIELDISGIVGREPVVAHGTDSAITTNYFSLRSMFSTISAHGFNTSDPLILYLEIYNTDNAMHVGNIKNLIIEYFGSRLLNYNNKTSGKIDFTKIPIYKLLNKLIIVTNNDKNGIMYGINDVAYRQEDNTSIANTSNNAHVDAAIFDLNRDKSRVSRVYMDGSLSSYLSKNLEPVIYWTIGHNIVTCNFGTRDTHLLTNLRFFKNRSFRLKSELTTDVIKEITL